MSLDLLQTNDITISKGEDAISNWKPYKTIIIRDLTKLMCESFFTGSYKISVNYSESMTNKVQKSDLYPSVML